MKQPILLLDTNYLCHRAYHAMGDLTYGDEGFGAVFGVLRDIVNFQETFHTPYMIFAFDLGRGYRYNDLPEYKSSRRSRHADAPKEEQAKRKELQKQITKLRTEYLPEAGFKNVYAVDGFEADDIIASLAQSLPPQFCLVATLHRTWLAQLAWPRRKESRQTFLQL